MAERVCPVWIGYLLSNPLRKLFQHPQKILSPYVKEGMQVLDIGSAMGFFSIPLAQLVGSTGKVLCVDMQEKMLKILEKRAQKAGVLQHIETRTCQQQSLGLKDVQEEVDFALLFAVVHEVPDQARLFAEVSAALKPGGKVLVAEPKGHVSAKNFERSVAVAQQQGFTIVETPHIRQSHTALLKK